MQEVRGEAANQNLGPGILDSGLKYALQISTVRIYTINGPPSTHRVLTKTFTETSIVVLFLSRKSEA
jgi:hypothetical protein